MYDFFKKAEYSATQNLGLSPNITKSPPSGWKAGWF